MGDMGDYFNEWKEDKKARKVERLTEFEETWKEIFEKNGVVKHTNWHYQFKVAEKLLDYYPSTGKWVWDKKTYFGRPADLQGFIRKRNA